MGPKWGPFRCGWSDQETAPSAAKVADRCTIHCQINVTLSTARNLHSFGEICDDFKHDIKICLEGSIKDLLGDLGGNKGETGNKLQITIITIFVMLFGSSKNCGYELIISVQNTFYFFSNLYHNTAGNLCSRGRTLQNFQRLLQWLS